MTTIGSAAINETGSYLKLEMDTAWHVCWQLLQERVLTHSLFHEIWTAVDIALAAYILYSIWRLHQNLDNTVKKLKEENGKGIQL